VNQIKGRFPEAPVVLLDSGNFSDNPTAEGDVKTKGLLEGMRRLGYDAVNVGERDIRMGYPEFARRTEASDFTFLSANIVDRKTKKPIFEPHTVIETTAADGEKVKVGVVGMVRYNPVFLKAGPKGGNIVIAHPLERVKAEVEALKKKGVDVVVVLAAAHKNDAHSIASKVAGIDYVLGSYGGLVTNEPESRGETTILYSGNRGQRVTETRLFLDGGAIRERTTKLHMLTRHYPPDLEMLEFVNSVPHKKPVETKESSSRARPQGAAVALGR